MSGMDRLLPCPFCGGNATLRGDGTAPECWVSCACGASSDTGGKARAIAAWNRRASQAAPAQPTEAMLDAARDWSDAKYGKPIGNDAAIGCWNAMLAAAPAPSDGLREALERIAEQQMYRSGYDQTDISVEPVLSASEMQDLARAALTPEPAQEGERRHD